MHSQSDSPHVRPPVEPQDHPSDPPTHRVQRDLLWRIGRVGALVAAIVVALGASDATQGVSAAVAIEAPLPSATVALATATPTPTPTPKPSAPTPSPTKSPTRKTTPRPTVRRTNAPAPEVVGTAVTPTGIATTGPQPVTLQDYLDLVPAFPPAPAPEKVTLSHADGRAALYDNSHVQQGRVHHHR